MNKKIKYIITMLILIIFGFGIVSYEYKEKNVIHQHLVSKKETKAEDEGSFNTHLPFICIKTNGKEIPGEERDGESVEANIELYNKKNKMNSINDEPIKISKANIRYRGNSSMDFDKKGYLIKFIKNDGTSNKVDVFDMGKHDEWVLHGPFLDKTLIRNYMWYNISSEIMEYAPETRFCELFVDNQYKGMYLAVESITRGDKDRIRIKKYKKGDNVSSYILRLDRGSRNELKNLNNFTKYSKIIEKKLKLDIEYPNSKYLNNEIIDTITKDLSKFEKSLYSFDYKEYEKYIDVNSFVDYFIINEFTQNYDAGSLSTYIYKDVRGKYKLCVWDFNNAYNNFIDINLEDTDFSLQNALWFQILLKDPKFVDKIINRYKQLRKTYLNEDYLLKYIDDTVEYLGTAKDRNFEVWGYTFDEKNDFLPIERKIGSYEEAIKQFKDAIIKRGRWLDEHIEELKQFSHESVNKKYNH